MLSPKMEEALNSQVNAELFSSYLYLSIAAYFESAGFPGMATWMRFQTQEENLHGMKIYDFILERNGKVVLEAMCTGTLPLTCNEAFGDVFGPELAPRLMYAPGDTAALAERLAALLALPADEAEDLGRLLRTKVLIHHDIADLIPRLVSAMRSRS